MGSPRLVASASRMLRRMGGSTTTSPKCSRSKAATCWFSKVGACIVINTPSTRARIQAAADLFNRGQEHGQAFEGEIFGLHGTSTPSAAQRALMASTPRFGGVSMSTRS